MTASGRSAARLAVDEDVMPGSWSGEPALALAGVEVRYGRRLVLAGVDLAIPEGEIYALLGSNGSGKSSLVRTLLGLQPPQVGTLRVLGRDPWRERAALMEQVGFVAEESQAPPEMTARQLVAFCGSLRRQWEPAAIEARLQRFAVPLDRAFRKLSKGQKNQVELALALGHRPRLVVLDDPTLGLDPLARRAFFGELMGELADSGTTVLLTTHDLSAVEGIADRVGILGRGRLLVNEPLERLKARFRKLLLVPGGESAIGEPRMLARRDRPWGTEVVVGDWEEETMEALQEAQPLSLEEICAALHGAPTPEPEEGR